MINVTWNIGDDYFSFRNCLDRMHIYWAVWLVSEQSLQCWCTYTANVRVPLIPVESSSSTYSVDWNSHSLIKCAQQKHFLSHLLSLSCQLLAAEVQAICMQIHCVRFPPSHALLKIDKLSSHLPCLQEGILLGCACRQWHWWCWEFPPNLQPSDTCSELEGTCSKWYLVASSI